MIEQSFNLGQTTNILFNGQDVQTLKLNTQTIWNNTAIMFNVTRFSDTAPDTGEIKRRFIAFNVTAGVEDAIVTYGGIQKTVPANTTAEISFGEFTAGTDDGTPESGTISFRGTIEEIAGYTFTIDKNTTGYCTCVTDVISLGNLKRIGAYLFYKTTISQIQLPNSIVSIGANAFAYCNNLGEVQLPNSIISIGDNAFAHCANLNITQLPIYLQELGTSAFNNCTNFVGNAGRIDLPNTLSALNERIFPNGITRINTDIANCIDLRQNTNITKFLDPSSITNPLVYVHSNIVSLKTINSSSISAVNSTQTGYFDLRNLTQLQEFSISNNDIITKLDFAPNLTRLPVKNGSRFCSKCKNLTTINSSITGTCDLTQFTDLGDDLQWAIANKDVVGMDSAAITKIRFNPNITKIPAGLCYNCAQLIDIVIPANVTFIGNHAFQKAGAANRAAVSVVFEITTNWQYNRAGGGDPEDWQNIASGNLARSNNVDSASPSAPNLLCGIHQPNEDETAVVAMDYSQHNWRRTA